MTILDLLRLNSSQLEAATVPGDLVVAAGAGSGKTRTLVGRYLGLLESGVPLRAIVAITFTDKAAREMRTRIRQAIAEWLQTSEVSETSEVSRTFWEEAFADLDAARIGTIHSLCAQVLRDQPVEAARLGYPPGFGVLEEGHAAVLRARAVEDALAWAAEDDAASRLFGALDELGLRSTVATLLEKRLDADAAFERLTDDPLERWADVLRVWLDEQLDDSRWRGCLDALVSLRADDPADAMEVARQEVLAHAGAVDDARRRGDPDAALAALAALWAATTLKGRKANWPGDALETAKEAMRELRAYFDERLQPLADPKKPAAWALDEQVAGLAWTLHAVYRRAVDAYVQAKRVENGLDFDDLEAGALALLRDSAVRAAWQTNVRAVLVDEFQDTNERQRQIVYALSSFAQSSVSNLSAQTGNGSLFVVGDAKQSIYRFRGADVTVFRRVQDDVARSGGRIVPLDLTFRAHEPLVTVTDRLLAPVLDGAARPGRPYAVPFAPLEAYRAEPRVGIGPPFVEFLLGLGESASQGRQAAAEGLAAHLLELRDREDVRWHDVALLFRASTAFSAYEDALERASIPFVTVAGRGFYDRYEVRDLLNALAAVADPTDDLALVGFLRSPTVGLTDAALYLLRSPPTSVVPRDPHRPCSVWSILSHPALPDIVPPDDLASAVRGRDLIAELHDLAGRVGVAVLLKQLLDRTHYRAALQAVEGESRARRNVDKLLADAHTSDLVSVREFLEYVRALRDVGVRESEAPTEAGSAVQLMTVHKAKGLEFPVVVIADAAHAGHRDTATVRLDARLGVTLNLRDRDDDRRPAAYRLAALRDTERDEAEDRRLLYVAATRAREKLLVSAHTKVLKGGGLSTTGWLKLLGQVAGLDEVAVAGTPVEPQPLPLAHDVGCILYPWRKERPHAPHITSHVPRITQPASQDLVAPLIVPPTDRDSKLATREAQPPRRVWRVVPQTKQAHAPAWVVGTLVHVALRHWCFEDERLEPFLRPFVLEMGVVEEAEIHAAAVEAKRLLRRFRAHSLWTEMDAAQRWHEVGFSVIEDGRPVNGIVDLLYRTGAVWRIIEFKTDEVRAGADLHAHIREEGYDQQVRRYARAVGVQLGMEVEANLVFLNVGNEVAVVPVGLNGSETVR
jgi:ATP-dependent helicase/nuclease subunit A